MHFFQYAFKAAELNKLMLFGNSKINGLEWSKLIFNRLKFR